MRPPVPRALFIFSRSESGADRMLLAVRSCVPAGIVDAGLGYYAWRADGGASLCSLSLGSRVRSDGTARCVAVWSQDPSPGRHCSSRNGCQQTRCPTSKPGVPSSRYSFVSMDTSMANDEAPGRTTSGPGTYPLSIPSCLPAPTDDGARPAARSTSPFVCVTLCRADRTSSRRPSGDGHDGRRLVPSCDGRGEKRLASRWRVTF